MSLFHDFVSQLKLTAPESFWPVSTTGWITLLGFVASTGWIVFRMGRWASRVDGFENDLNGVGLRITKVENAQNHEEGRVDALEVQLSRTQGQYEALIKILSEAKENVAAFREGTVVLGEKIESKIETLRREQGDTKLHLSERLKAVETILEHHHDG